MKTHTGEEFSSKNVVTVGRAGAFKRNACDGFVGRGIVRSRRRAGSLLWGVAVCLALVLNAAPATAVTEDEYLQALSAELDKSTIYLDEAAAAISECRLTISCLQNPEPYAVRLDNAVLGLEKVVSNLSGMEVPERYVTSHQQLIRGYGQVIDGFILYAEGLREHGRDPTKFEDAVNLVREGRTNITEANNAIFARTPPTFDLVLILIITVLATAGALVVLMVFLGRQAAQERHERVRDELATCPKCSQVLDQWWTYRRRQIRQWRVDHLKSHERDTRPQIESGDGKSG